MKRIALILTVLSLSLAAAAPAQACHGNGFHPFRKALAGLKFVKRHTPGLRRLGR